LILAIVFGFATAQAAPINIGLRPVTAPDVTILKDGSAVDPWEILVDISTVFTVEVFFEANGLPGFGGLAAYNVDVKWDPLVDLDDIGPGNWGAPGDIFFTTPPPDRVPGKDIQEVALDSYTQAIRNEADEELNENAVDAIDKIPKIQQENNDIDRNSTDCQIIETFQDIHFEEDYIEYDDPADIISTIHKLGFPDSVLFSFLKNKFKFRDKKDYNEIKKSFITPLRDTFKEVFGSRFHDSLYLSAFRLAHVYGLPPIKTIDPQNIYTKAYDFYKGHEGDFSVTFSTSSGLPNPLERFGTDVFVNRYLIAEEKIGDVLLKNPYRK